MIQEQIKNGIKESMLAKNSIRLETLRFASSAIVNELVAKGRKPNEELSDEEVLVVLSRLAKQRKDSIEQFKKGGREDLVKEEEAQLKVLEGFLPQMMKLEEIEKIAKTKKEELGIADPSKKGLLMQALMKELKGKADGMEVKKVVDALF